MIHDKTEEYKAYVSWAVQSNRKRQGVTLAEVADACDLSTSYISDIEKGKTLPSIEALNRIGRYLDFSVPVGSSEPYPNLSDQEKELVLAWRDGGYPSILHLLASKMSINGDR